jgi:hypothetical protein
MNINEARAANKGRVIIWYPFSLGGQLADRWMWCAEKNGDVIDYDKRDNLISDALAAHEEVVVFTCHRNGSVSTKRIMLEAG